MPSLRLSAVLTAVSLFLISACLPNPAPGPGTPILTPAQPNAPMSTPTPAQPNAPMSTPTPTRPFVTRFGSVTFGQRVFLDGIRDGELLAPKINLWNQPEGDRWIVCSLPHGAVVTVDALSAAGQHARATSVDNPACTGWVHKDFLHP